MRRQKLIVFVIVGTVLLFLGYYCMGFVFHLIFGQRLSDGYRINVWFSECNMIAHDTRIIMDNSVETNIFVGPSVDHYRQLGEYVIGHVSSCRTKCCLNSKSSPVTGYFVLDKKSGKTIKGMTKKQWLSELRLRGIRGEPLLFRPTRLSNLIP